MNNISRLLVVMAPFMGSQGNAQSFTRAANVTIKTSAVCEMCKSNIENKLNITDGVISSSLDLESKEVRVNYESELLSAGDIRQLISEIGYDADHVLKKSDAYAALPNCCK